MFIECSNCEFKYLVNSADLKPNGRMVECANCGHQWFQIISNADRPSSVPSTNNKETENIKNKENISNQFVKNLPSTVVKYEKPSIINSTIVVFLIVLIFIGVWISRSFEINTIIVLLNFYIKEFFFNLNLIFSDLVKIIYDILN